MIQGDPSSSGEGLTLASWAMATRFELVLHGDDPIRVRAAGEEALSEIQSLEGQLNFYSSSSELSRLNARAAQHPVKVEPGLFQLLTRAKSFHEETGGAFDITIAPLMRCWGFMKDTGHLPSEEALAQARSLVGMDLIELDPSSYTVHFKREGVLIDLGSIGKGYAIEVAAQCLRENGIRHALIHGGTSTVCALGHPPDQEAWKVAIEFPPENTTHPTPEPQPDPQSPQPKGEVIAVAALKDEALSVSAVWGKAFQSEEKTFGHVIDPRTGAPTQEAMLSAVILPSATATDAYATALLIGGPEEQTRLAVRHPALRSLVAGRRDQKIWVCPHRMDP